MKQIWGDIKRDLQQLFDQKLEASGVDPMFVGQFRSDFETDLKVFFTEQTERLYRFKRNMSTPVPKVTALHLEDACDTLFIDPPDETKPVPDAYRKKARRQMRLLAKEHHVDRNPGCEVEARERYDEVMRAYETLSNYLDDLDRKHEKRFQVINGGMA